MLNFVKNAFRQFFGAILWLVFIFMAIGGAVRGFHLHGGLGLVGGLIIGAFIGLIYNIIVGGFIATVLNMDRNIEEQTKILKEK
ncbi:MAG: hypothetical protein FWE37_06810 [Spirochaetaceae bacterium]|nr:hypothetical protein [Spirochaetaceae bacterium]